ncbi:hypothetical protein HMPREF1146_1759 [Prevotella sp. MSX73]|nr:hypothetical protein HMPREF1146_1759 [Prevotella sp. MSX73]
MAIPIRLICLIRPIKILTKPKRQSKRATLGSSLGPSGKVKEAVRQGCLGRIVICNGKKTKKGSTLALPLLMQRYNLLRRKQNV